MSLMSSIFSAQHDLFILLEWFTSQNVKWPYNCFIGCCFKDLFKTACSNLVYNKLVNLVKGDLEAPFSIATTSRSRGGRYYIPRIAPLYPWSSPYSAECLARWHQVPFFESLVWLNLGLNLGLPDYWQIVYSLGQ